FSSATIDRSLASFRRHGIMAVLIPSILPPPAPFKIFLLLAGVANISVTRFTIAIAIGRGARYFLDGLLALRYGDRAVAFMHEHAGLASLVAVGALVLGMLVYIRWTKAQGENSR